MYADAEGMKDLIKKKNEIQKEKGGRTPTKELGDSKSEKKCPSSIVPFRRCHISSLSSITSLETE